MNSTRQARRAAERQQAKANERPKTGAEVFAKLFDELNNQARLIAEWERVMAEHDSRLKALEDAAAIPGTIELTAEPEPQTEGGTE